MLTVELAALNKEDPKNLGRILHGFSNAVGLSLRTHKPILLLTTPSETTVKERTTMCLRIFNRMRREPSPPWPLAKCLDMLPKALQDELDGVAWEPPKEDRAMWTTTQLTAKGRNQ